MIKKIIENVEKNNLTIVRYVRKGKKFQVLMYNDEKKAFIMDYNAKEGQYETLFNIEYLDNMYEMFNNIKDDIKEVF